MRKPDFVIGNPDDPYMLRWWVIPRNKWFCIYLHKFLKSDDDRALHDHPWWNISLIIKGRDIENMPVNATDPRGDKKAVLRKAWRPIFRRAEASHQIELIPGDPPVWTIFIRGREVREWGFWCPQGWRFWKDFVLPTAKGQVGKGCD